MGAHFDIVKIFDRPVKPEDVAIRYGFPQDLQERVFRLNEALSRVVEERKKEHPAEELEDALRNDREYGEALREIALELAPGLRQLSAEELTAALHKPSDNRLVVFHTGHEHDANNNSLELQGVVAPYVLTQLMYSNKILQFMRGSKINPIAINYSTRTSKDQNILPLWNLGWRGGTSFPDTLNQIPASQILYNPANHSYQKSHVKTHREELGLGEGEFESGLVGLVQLHETSNHIVLAGVTDVDMTSEELRERYEGAVDRKSHKRLFPIPDEPTHVLDFIKHNMWDPAKADQSKLTATTNANYGTILPGCAACLVTEYLRRDRAVQDTVTKYLGHRVGLIEPAQ